MVEYLVLQIFHLLLILRINQNHNLSINRQGIGKTKLIPDKEQNRDYSFMQAIEEEIGKEIINTLESNKLVYDMTVISNFIYSSSVGGTNTVYKI